jgi:exo-beta-1,3-glucanase (GH17 family)
MQYYFFDGYDAPWKQAGNLAVEQHWGIWQANGNSKGVQVKVTC